MVTGSLLQNSQHHGSSLQQRVKRNHGSTNGIMVVKKQKKENMDVKTPIIPSSPQEGLSESQKRKAAKFEKLKLRNPAADFVTQCNLLYHSLLDSSKNSTTEERQQKVQECIDFVDGFDVQSPQAFIGKARLLCVNRCLQMCYKYGSPQQKQFITDKLQEEFVQMATTDKGMYLCQKMLKYADNEGQEMLMEKLITYKNFDLFYSKFGSKVVASALAHSNAAPFRKRLLTRLSIPKVISVQVPNLQNLSVADIYNKSDDRGKKQIKEHLERVISRCVDKEIVDRTYFHEIFEFFSSIAVEEELQSMLASLQGCLALLLSTRVGCVTICRLLNVADAKSRRKFISSWKDTHITPFEIVMNPVSNIVILKLLSCVDDTKLLKESILASMMNFNAKSGKPNEGENGTTIVNLCLDKTARKVLLMLLCDEYHRYLNQEEKKIIEERSLTSKKDTSTRRAELFEFMACSLGWVFTKASDSFMETWINNREGRDVLVEYLSRTKDNKVLDVIFSKIENLKDEQLGELFDHQTGQRTLVSLLRIGASFKPMMVAEKDHSCVAKDDLLQNSNGVTLHEYLYQKVAGDLLSTILATRGIFVIVDLLTIIIKCNLKQESEMKMFKQHCLSALSKIESKETSGLRLLQSKLTEI